LDPSRDFPQDFYIYTLEKMNKKLSVIEELKDIKLNRKIIKSSVVMSIRTLTIFFSFIFFYFIFSDFTFLFLYWKDDEEGM